MRKGSIIDLPVRNWSEQVVAQNEAFVRVGDVGGAGFLLHQHAIGISLDGVKADLQDLGCQFQAPTTAGTLPITVVRVRSDLHHWNAHQSVVLLVLCAQRRCAADEGNVTAPATAGALRIAFSIRCNDWCRLAPLLWH